MLSRFLKNLSILKKFLFINFLVFLIIGLLTLIYLNRIQPTLIKTKTVNHINTLDNTIEKNLKKMGYKTESKLPLTCLQTIMFSDGMYYGYGDFRRVDALASGNIND